ncbi:MAG: BppU family phage baseplate upper protein [Nitrospirota bacterium]
MKAIKLVKGEKRDLKYQLKENGAVKDITGMTFKFAAKATRTSATYQINPIAAALDDPLNGKFSFTLTAANATGAVFKGVYEISMYDAGSNKTVLTTPGGDPIEIVEDIVD